MKKNRSLNLGKLIPIPHLPSLRQMHLTLPINIYQWLFKNSSYANIVSDSEGRIHECNHAASKLFGYTEQELISIGMVGIIDMEKTKFLQLLKNQTGKRRTKTELTGIKKSRKKFQCGILSMHFTDENSEKKILNIIVDAEQRVRKNNIGKNDEIFVLANEIMDSSAEHQHIGEKKEGLYAIDVSHDVIWDWNILTNEVFFGNAYEELFGYKIPANKGILDDLIHLIHPEDKQIVEEGLYKSLESGETRWNDAYRIIRADGSVANLTCRGIIKRDDNGKAYRMMGAMQDVTKKNELEKKLEEEIKIRELQITEAVVATDESVRSEIGMELHDNVNQLLGVTKLYIELAKRDKKNRDNFLNQCSIFTLNAIEEIRKLSKGWISPETKDMILSDAIKNIIRDAAEANPVKIIFKVNDFKENEVTGKFKLNLFRIVQEQLNNTLKHAQASEIRIDLSQTEKEIILSISDDGIGFDTTIPRKGVGISNITRRAKLYNGRAEFLSNLKKGCVLILNFPAAEAVK